jgi:hypothetical protein
MQVCTLVISYNRLGRSVSGNSPCDIEQSLFVLFSHREVLSTSYLPYESTKCGRDHKSQGPVSQQVLHDKDPTCSKVKYAESKFEVLHLHLSVSV